MNATTALRAAGAAARPPLPAPPKTPLAVLIGWAVVIGLLAASWRGAEMRPWDLVRDFGNMTEYARGFFPPDFREWQHYLKEMAVTLKIALWGTALAVVCSVPLALLASANLTP